MRAHGQLGGSGSATGGPSSPSIAPQHTSPRALVSAELQLVFLYRCLSENLEYISTMLAMRPPPLDQPEPGAAAPAGGDGIAGQSMPAASAAVEQVQQATPTAQAPLQPFVLLMDVQADAPNICLPRSTGTGLGPRGLTLA